MIRDALPSRLRDVRRFLLAAIAVGLSATLCAAWTCPGYLGNRLFTEAEPLFGKALLNQDSPTPVPVAARGSTQVFLTGTATFLDRPASGPDGLVQARISLANELLGKTKASLPVDFFKVALGLEQSSELELLEKGRVIFWQPLANSSPGWSPRQVSSKGGQYTLGSAFVAIPSVTLRKFNLGSVQNEILDLGAALVKSGVVTTAETYVLYEDPRYPDNVKDHYKQLLKTYPQGFNFYVPPEIALDGLPSATRSNLPQDTAASLIVLDSSNLSTRGMGIFAKTLTFKIPNQGTVQAKFELEEIPGTPLRTFPSRLAGHTLINSMEINSDFSLDNGFEIFAYKKAVGKSPFSALTITNIRSLFDGKQRIDGLALEGFEPRDWNTENLPEYRLAVVFRVGDQYFSVLTLEQGAVDLSSRASTTSLFYRMASF